MEEPAFPFKEDTFYFVTAGRLVRQKGQWDLLKAFRLLCDTQKRAELLILGAGPLESDLKELAQTLNISEKVHFLWFQDNPYAYMKRADAFVLTSLHEGLGNVILEAMACGLPVISTDCSAGPREILAPGSDLSAKAADVEYQSYGVLVPEISTEQQFDTVLSEKHALLSGAMNGMMTDPAMRRRYGKANAERLRAFSPKAIAENWENLLTMVGNNA